MNTIFNAIQSLKNVQASITVTEQFTYISVRPNTTGINDPAVEHIQPFIVKYNPKEHTEEYVADQIMSYVPKAIEVVDSISSYEKAVKKANEEQAAKKKEKEEKEKLEKEIKTKYNELKELLSADEDDEFEHTKLLNKFKTTYKDAKLINELQDLYDKKYNKLDLFSQL